MSTTTDAKPLVYLAPLLNGMPLSFVAEIRLLATEAGGRNGPLLSGEWRTVLGVDNEHWSARLVFLATPSPGEVFQASVQLLVPEALGHFPVGAEFTVWEGGTKGVGRVLSIASKSFLQGLPPLPPAAID